MFPSVVFDGVLGPSWPSVTHLAVSLYHCSCGRNAEGALRAFKGRHVILKALQGFETEMRELLTGTEEKSI